MNWIKWLERRVSSEKDRETMQEFIGMCTLDRSLHKTEKALLLCNDGASGKSTFQKVIETALGEWFKDVKSTWCCSHLFYTQQYKRWTLDRLNGQNVCFDSIDEIKGEKNRCTLKRFISNEKMVARVFRGTPYETTSLPFLVLATNDDWGKGNRRIIRIDMNGITEPYETRIAETFSSKEVANWIRQGVERFINNGYKFTNIE